MTMIPSMTPEQAQNLANWERLFATIAEAEKLQRKRGSYKPRADKYRITTFTESGDGYTEICARTIELARLVCKEHTRTNAGHTAVIYLIATAASVEAWKDGRRQTDEELMSWRRAERFTIVIAWTEEDQEIVKHGRVDIGERHTFKAVTVGKAAIWLNDGDAADLEKARAYAQANGYTVYTFPISDDDPRPAARLRVVKDAKNVESDQAGCRSLARGGRAR